MKPTLYCPRCGSDRVGRLPPNPVSPFRGYRCGGCGRRLRDRWSAPVYVGLLAVVAGVAAVAVPTAGRADGPRAGDAWGPYQVMVVAGVLAAVGYAAVELTRPTPRTRPPAPPAPPAPPPPPPPAAGGGWYYARAGVRVGPFGFDQLRQLAAAGAVAPADMVLDPAAGSWLTAAAVPGLFPGRGEPG